MTFVPGTKINFLEENLRGTYRPCAPSDRDSHPYGGRRPHKRTRSEDGPRNRARGARVCPSTTLPVHRLSPARGNVGKSARDRGRLLSNRTESKARVRMRPTALKHMKY